MSGALVNRRSTMGAAFAPPRAPPVRAGGMDRQRSIRRNEVVRCQISISQERAWIGGAHVLTAFKLPMGRPHEILAEIDDLGGGASNETCFEFRQDHLPGLVSRNPHYLEFLNVWRNEQAAPDVLDYRADLVDGLLHGVEQQERMIEGTLENAADVEECLFSAPMYQTELARVRFVLGAYIRVRLAKIENQAGHIFADPEIFSRLSERERAHCDQYLMLLHEHQRTTVLSDLPQPFADETDADACPELLGKAATNGVYPGHT
mmetsp:Transcript_4217/g.13341  ORF Transcript_4217/g.13341 Transcript_4217/m.13341 type:complete len:262 (-) Transcript_4217:455-1240(-)